MAALEDRLVSHENAFTALRLIVALAVGIDHAWIATTGDANDIPIRILDMTPGWLGVNGFFFLSGLLIAKSLEQRGAGLEFALSRALRIWPALVALSLIAVLLIGPVVALALGEPYWSDPDWLTYPLRVLFFLDVETGPPGFFPGNPEPHIFSVPLWTLRYEVLCYIGAAVAFALGIWRTRWGVLATLVGFGVAALVIDPLETHNLPGLITIGIRFGWAFTLGAAVWAWRHRITLHWAWLIGAAALCVFAELTGYFRDPAGSFALGVFIVFAGLHPAAIRTLGSGKTDVSYGYYIWHYPMMQILVGFVAGITPLIVLILGTAMGLAAGWASWVWIEKPALALKRRMVKAPAPA
ncbi:MAG: acyltransferase [Pseudomonadota bacterium]